MGEMRRGCFQQALRVGGCLTTVTVHLNAGSLSPSEVSQSVVEPAKQLLSQAVCGESEDFKN